MNIDTEKRIITKEELLRLVSEDERCFLEHESLVEISDLLFKKFFTILKEGYSLRYDDNTPFIKTKLSVPNHLDGSPRTPRNNRVICSIKIPLNEKE